MGMHVKNAIGFKLAQIDVPGVIDVDQLVDGTETGGLIKAVPIVGAGRVRRRPPVFVNSNAVPTGLRDHLNAAFAQKYSTHTSLHLLSLAGAVVVGQGTVAVSAGNQYRLLNDSAVEFLAHGLVPDGMERGEGEGFVIRQQVHRRIEQSCLLLQRPWSNNFGHWLIDQAMALSYLVHTGALPTNHIVVAKVWSDKLREIMLQTIAAILPDAVMHEHPDLEVWHFRHLHYITPLHVPPLFKLPAALDCLRKDILAVPVPDVPRPRRFHIVRQGKLRSLANETEIIALSAAHGFEPISPENLSMAEQAALFHQAEAVLGVKGAAMTNILFANSNCRLMVMSPSTFTDPFFWDIASTRGIAYSEIFGEIVNERQSAGHNDFRVDPADVEAMIRATLRAGPAS
jgi:capsular polysaccharide biosynthesis protein